MNKLRCILYLCVLSVAIAGMGSCAKYKSTVAKPYTGDTTRYCNDPNAVNYNWNFPGVPDSTVCFYPTDVFAGVYLCHDSIYLASSGLFIRADTLILTIIKHTETAMTLSGFCPTPSVINMTAGLQFSASIDTAVGDSVTDISGQLLCGVPDTIAGNITQNQLDDSIIYINFTVSDDTGLITNHQGSARLLHK